MKKLSRILSCVLVLCLLLTLMPAVYAEENSGDIVIFYTDDVHTYVNGSLGYDKAADLKSEAAKTAAGVLLVDAGDHIQGTDYGSVDQGENVMKLMKAAGYDLATLGNHEFDYGMDRALAITDEATYGIPYVSCNFYHVEDGVRGENVLESYKVFTFGDRKVALIGITTPESQSKAPATFQDASGKDIYGVSGYANTADLYADVQKAIDAASKEADYVIALGHLGDMESSGDWVSASLIANTSGLDAFIDGHSHNSYECLTVKDKDNNDVVLSQAGAYFNAIGKLTIAADGTITTELIKEHEGSNAEVKEFQEETWNAYMGQTLATATGDFPSTNLGTAPSAFVDLLNAVQIWGGYDRTGDNTPDDPSDDTPAMLSISAPLNSGSEGNIISEGEIKLGDIYNLYRFENWFYQIRMTGEEIHQWLEFAASKIETDENGDPFITAKNLTYYDIVYGDGFSYIIDYTREAGNRVVSMTYNGIEVTTTQEFTVMLNNFRYKDGGGYLTYLTEHGCPFTANDPDRIIYSTQYDMIEGQNLGTARALLMAYIREQEFLSPVITSTWHLVANYDAEETVLKTELVADSNNMFKYGHLDLNVSTDEFLTYFSYGDIVTVTFNGKSYDFPVCSNYDDVDSFEYLIRAASGKKVVTMAINYGKLGVEAGIIEAAPEGSDVKYQLCEGVTFPIEATVTMKEVGGYAEELSIRQLNRTNNRDEYPELTDEQFANFRMVTTSGMGEGVLYRSSSPINPDLGRNTYADAAAKAAGVKTFINLADTEAEATGYEGYAESYYSAQNHIFLGLPVAFTSDEFKNGLAEGFRYMTTHEGPYLVHCTEGKDRAGLTSAILECFMGATAEEISEDYLTTFRNYYNVVDGVQTALTESQEAYLRSAILKNLALIFNVEDATTADLHAEAVAYFLEIGLSKEEIQTLHTNLGGESPIDFRTLKTELVADSNNMFKYGHLDLNVSTDEFLTYFSYGDIVTVTFNGQSYDFPVCSNYDDVDSFEYLIRAASGKKVVTMAINYGKLGVEAGIIEAAPEGSDVKYQLCEGVTFPIEATVTMKEAGGYAEELSIRQLNRTNNREDYPELTDDQFANFRMVTTSGIGTGVLYRSSSPINPDLGRNTYADAAAAAAGVKTFINLADTEAEATAYEGYAESYYSAQNHIFLGLPVAFTSDEFRTGLAEGFRYMATHEGPYLVHCTEGKDRAGLTSAILECFMGASAEEVAEDYVTTFRNYYNVVDGVQTPLTETQETYLRNAILKNLALIFDVDDITTANLQLEADSYLYYIGLRSEEIEALRINLRGIRYTDVDEDAWYFDYVKELTSEGLIEGYEDGTYQPEGQLTRAEAVTLLYRLSGSPTVESRPSFTDLPWGWYQNAIAWAEKNNVINGVGDGKFEPDEPVSREQFVTMLWRLEGKPESEQELTGFEDIETVNDWALEAFQWAVSEGIINGTTFTGMTGTYLAPQDAITRAETAKILVVFLATVKTPA